MLVSYIISNRIDNTILDGIIPNMKFTSMNSFILLTEWLKTEPIFLRYTFLGTLIDYSI